MAKVKRNWARLSDGERKSVIEDLILFFENERDEKIGIIAAEEVLNFFLMTVGNKLYNKGIDDAKKVLKNRYEELQFDLDDLLYL